MSLRLRILGGFMPEFIKGMVIRELYAATAAAFESALPDIRGLSYPVLLESYAAFLRDEGQKALEAPENLAAVRQRLFEGAFEIGRKFRLPLGIRRYEDVIKACRLFYGILKIGFEADGHRSFKITTCYFSGSFSPGLCGLASGLDEGAVAGLSGMHISFNERLTDGGTCCRGQISLEGS